MAQIKGHLCHKTALSKITQHLCLTMNEIVWSKKSSNTTSSDTVHGPWLQVDE